MKDADVCFSYDIIHSYWVNKAMLFLLLNRTLQLGLITVYLSIESIGSNGTGDLNFHFKKYDGYFVKMSV